MAQWQTPPPSQFGNRLLSLLHPGAIPIRLFLRSKSKLHLIPAYGRCSDDDSLS